MHPTQAAGGHVTGHAGDGLLIDYNLTAISETRLIDLLPSTPETISLAILLSLLILTTLVGNIFVVFAILTDKNLKRIGNYLILSLAVADFFVAVTVMPVGAIYEVTGEWPLGATWCELWTCLDVLCCTASILHLVAIALDRYWTVTNIDYVHLRSARCVVKMLVTIWAVAAIVSLGPTFGWKDEDFDKRIVLDKTCLVSQDISYQVFATCSTFYGPLVVILMLYWKIFKVARKRIRHKPGKNVQMADIKNGRKAKRKDKHNKVKKDKKTPTKSSSKNELDPVTKVNSSTDNSNDKEINSDEARSSSADSQLIVDTDLKTKQTTSGNTLQVDSNSYREMINQDSESVRTLTASVNGAGHATDPGGTGHATRSRKQVDRESLDAKRERKAAKTLAIITGVFVICWLPFFIVALFLPLCGATCHMPKIVFSFFQWLGYINSMLNPIIYTIFSPDFRVAFQRILLGRKTPTRSRCRV
ncbi:5-hydroxytryptamine receptor [Halotydeus destructor]|nr:5-hydroxytryptamine receptor [Halotydeus destructor]